MNPLPLTILLLLTTLVSGAPKQPAIPIGRPSCEDLATVANQYISIGEEAAFEKLKSAWMKSLKKESFGDHFTRERIGWVCRLLYKSDEGTPLRQPLFGGLGLPWNTMKLKDWPLYPIAESNGVFFVLGEGYMLAGVPEDPIDYLTYCRENGTFRTKQLTIPTKKIAQTALRVMFENSRWKKIEWKDSEWNSGGGGFEYAYDEERIKESLMRQTKF